MIVTTESGSSYEFDKGNMRMKRISKDPLRRDGEWIKLLEYPTPVVGEIMILALESLGYGEVTMRASTTVISIEGE